MTQSIVFDCPPLFDEIDAAFHVRGKPVLFAFGDRIFNPQRVAIPPELLVHEAAHGRRQGSGQQIIDWWKRYIDDPKFRLAEEVPAHQAELDWLLEMGNRQQRRRALKQTAAKLADPLYGRLVTPVQARELLVVRELLVLRDDSHA